MTEKQRFSSVAALVMARAQRQVAEDDPDLMADAIELEYWEAIRAGLSELPAAKKSEEVSPVVLARARQQPTTQAASDSQGLR